MATAELVRILRGGARFGGRFDKYKTQSWDIRDAKEILHENETVFSEAGERPTVKKKKDQISWDVAPGPEYFEELFRISERQIVWGGNYFPLPSRRGFVIWDKKIPNEVSFASCEYGWVSWPMNAKIFRRYPPQSHVQRDELCKRFHPTQKPEALYCWLLQMFAKPGDHILDTHAGSCTSLVAAYQMGFPAVGIEIDAGYCEKAVERLEMEMQQGKLF